MVRLSVKWISFGIAVVTCLQLTGSITPAAQPSILIRVESNQVRVEEVASDTVQLRQGQTGLIVWADGERERWQLFNTRWSKPTGVSLAAPASEFELTSISRGATQHLTSGLAGSQLTTLLAQVRSQAIFRGVGSPVTPYAGARLLHSQITIRRDPGDGKVKLPAAEAVIRRGRTKLLTVKLPAGAEAIRWSAIPGLPAELKDGLPPGFYELELPSPTGLNTVPFTVLGNSALDRQLRKEKKLRDLLAEEEHQLYVQVAVEKLLANETPFLCDSLDLLETLPEKKLTSRLKQLRDHVRIRLQDPGQAPMPPLPPGRPTGDDLVDKTRALIAGGQWEQALAKLEDGGYDSTPAGQRRTGLAHLYRGVILSEAGAASQNDASAAFLKSIEILSPLPHAGEDSFRAHNNYAVFLLARTYDRLHNHTFQIAAGVKLPLISALQDWIEARRQFDAARRHATQPSQKIAVNINLARQTILLLELIRTFTDPADPKKRFKSAENLAGSTAERLATESLSLQTNSADSAVAHEIIGQIKFRQGDFAAAKTHASLALAAYVQHGGLAGIASAHRLLGLLHSNASASAMGPQPALKNAIRHFEISEQVSEVLRSRYPADHSGMALAGFMSRRIYSSAMIVDLLADSGKAQQALDHVERVKARSFSDMLHALQKNPTKEEPIVPVSKVLENWPEKTAAVEYFFTGQRCWVFVISQNGVQALALKGAGGAPIKPQGLLAKVRLARQMLNEYKSRWQDEAFTQRFDDAWQHQLHELQQILLPPAVRNKLADAKHLVIVPHHILHYLPFPALVTKVDNDAGPRRMARPSFLLDEPFAVSYAPSLSSWHVLRSAKVKPIQRVDVVADTRPEANLREVATELQAIHDAFGGKVQSVFDGDAATHDNALQILSKPGIAFFGCHGQNDWDAPLNGHLVLSDQILTANVLLGQRIASQVVVLSACHSGLADRSPLPGDDLFGLERVLLLGGANAVVSGNWLVDDLRGARITSALMANLARGKSADEALANAQRKVLHRYRSSTDQRLRFFSHPHFWAVFKLSGVYPASSSSPGSETPSPKPPSTSPSETTSSSIRPSETTPPEPGPVASVAGMPPPEEHTETASQNMPEQHKPTVTHTVSVENPYTFTIHYSVNGKSFAVGPHQTRWHEGNQNQPFRVEFDAAFKKGYQRRGYRLRNGSRNYFKRDGNGLDLFRH